jgi:aspartate kinase
MKNILVLKFGGTSLADCEKIKIAADRIIKSARNGHKIVCVVSAPAHLTDDLLSLGNLISKKWGQLYFSLARESDVLASVGEQISIALMTMAILQKGVDAVSLTGFQAGIRTDTRHTKSNIISINPSRILKELKKNKIVLVAGYQGFNSRFDITTLGRGGSDLTAIFLAKVLKARMCELYTDIQGIYTANPTINPQAKKIRQITYDELMELARTGVEVRQLKAIEFAKKHNVVLHLRSAFHSEKGTLVTNGKNCKK